VVDGPFTGGKEMILGFFVVEVDDLAAAEAIAGEAPCIPLGGSIEVRAIGDFPKPSR